jgi:hypothetical protein
MTTFYSHLLRFVAIRCGEPEDIMNGLLERKCQTFGCRISYACEPGYELHGNSHRWAPCSKSFKKSYELRGNSTKFAEANKQELEFKLSCMAIVKGGQQQKFQKLCVVMSYAATVQICRLSCMAIVTGGQNAAKA